MDCQGIMTIQFLCIFVTMSKLALRDIYMSPDIKVSNWLYTINPAQFVIKYVERGLN